MFEKHKSRKPDSEFTNPPQDSIVAPASKATSSGRAAVIGPGIHIKGNISGDENLIVEGRVDGKIHLEAHHVDVGEGGRVNADIRAKVIRIAGEVSGDLTGTEKVIISRSGNVHGNIVAPRMILEDGAIFKGSIDMDPGEPVKVGAAKPTNNKIIDKKVGKVIETPKVITTEKVKEKSAYSLNTG